MCACVRMCVCVCLCICVCMCVFVYMYVFVCVCAHEFRSTLQVFWLPYGWMGVLYTSRLQCVFGLLTLTVWKLMKVAPREVGRPDAA